MSRRNPNGLYPAGFMSINAAAKELGLDRETFFGQVDAGNVPSVRQPDASAKGTLRWMVAADVVADLKSKMGGKS